MRNLSEFKSGFNLTVVIRDSQGFEFSRLNSLLSRAFSQQDKNIKINGIINGFVTFK